MAYDYDLSLFSDLHKDARGHRPSAEFFRRLETSTPDELQALWDGLLDEMRQSEEDEARAEAEALVVLQQRLAGLQQQLGISQGKALEWLAQANDTQGDWHGLDWAMGVRFGTCERLAQAAV